jgi:hypothetical protein
MRFHQHPNSGEGPCVNPTQGPSGLFALKKNALTDRDGEQKKLKRN